MIGEYGPWDNDIGGSFTGRLFRWAEAHDRVKMMIYYRGVDPANEYNVQHYPGAREGASQPPRRAALGPVRAGGKELDDPPVPPVLGERPQARIFP